MNEKILIKNYQSAIDIFNDLTSETRVLLASTKAYSEKKISLVGASRVTLIGIFWCGLDESQRTLIITTLETQQDLFLRNMFLLMPIGLVLYLSNH